MEFRCYEVKIEESETAGSQQPTENPDNHQPSQSSTSTAQVVLNASVTHLAATQYIVIEGCEN